MPFVDPMLASGEPKKAWDPTGFWAEEKYDGHRLILEVTNDWVRGWSRYGLERKLPSQFEGLREYLYEGIYDGELLIPGRQSHNVVELTRQKDLVFVAFDILYEGSVPIMDIEWSERRLALEEAFLKEGGPVKLSRPTLVTCHDDVDEAFEAVVKAGGEGLILKNPESEYRPGKRPRNVWIKMKTVRSAVMEIIGFTAGRNGPFSKAVLEGDDLVRTTVKVLNDALLAEVHQNPRRFIGRKLRIEYTERYEGGKYRHPRWDHLLDEDNG